MTSALGDAFLFLEPARRRKESPPLPPEQDRAATDRMLGLVDGARVIYVGTFSKVLHPGLRLGYAGAREDVIECTGSWLACEWAAVISARSCR